MDGEELTLDRRQWERLVGCADATVFEARRLYDEADRRRRGRCDAAVTVISFSTAAAAVQFRRIAEAGLAAAPTSPDAAVTIALPDTIRGCLPLWVGWAMSLGTRDRAADEALMRTLLAPRAPMRGETDRGDPQAADGPRAEGASRRRGEPMESDDTIPAVRVGCHSRGGPEHAFRHTLSRRLLTACLADGGATPPPGMPDCEAVLYQAVGYHLAGLLGAEEALRECRGVAAGPSRRMWRTAMDDDRGTNLRLSQVSRVLVTSEQHLDAAGRRWVEDRAVAVVQDFSLVAVLDVERPEPPASAAALLAAAKKRGCRWLVLRSEGDTIPHDLIERLPVHEDVE